MGWWEELVIKDASQEWRQKSFLFRQEVGIVVWENERMPEEESKICYIHKSHNVSVLLYHLLSSTKHRKVVFNDSVDRVLSEMCLEISKRYEINFLEIGTDKDHAHFLI